MKAASLARPLLRSPALRTAAARRLESTAASKATDAAKDTVSKAQQGLSRVASAAGPAIAGAAKGVGNVLGKMGGRTGRLVGFIERQAPFVVYYSKVGAEVAKIVFHGQKMSPPPVTTFQNVYQNLWKSFQNGTLFPSPQSLAQQARNVSNAQLVAGGVVAAECLGFFTVGEIIGRFKIVGYRGETGTHH
ncbi:ATP synthase subunit g [Moelleriella libera RCEF 2490]|uniref:ATP synthase subunit g n=1 Tax=Moelleriella libera RCEF 2490 TaxID=1081109 RepID=A0A167Z2D2_9HYPO|nr:ATP synthase subunit g [Moelleriella libera RCEF 2490]